MKKYTLHRLFILAALVMMPVMAQAVDDAYATLKGNTHFPFSDLNNVEIADLMETWLEEKGIK